MTRDHIQDGRMAVLFLVLVGWVLASSSRAQTTAATTQPPPGSAQRNVLSVQVPCDRKVPVPPTLEIEVLDPNVDPLGNPAVLTRRGPEGLVVDIPPVVLVHRYYYTGDRSFQGPFLPGGPSIVVVNDPATGVRQYLEIQMLPGAPRVIYTRRSIVYDYGGQAITLTFKHLCKPLVTYSEGVSLSTRLKVAHAQRKQNLQELAERSGLAEANRKIHSGMKNAAVTAADRVHGLAKAVASPIAQVVNATPLGSALTTPPDQLAERQRDAEVQRAAAQNSQLNLDIPTVR